jgi:raffinose/stachyose/melibiose transport system permease protein
MDAVPALKPRRLTGPLGQVVTKVAMVAPAMALFAVFYIVPVVSGIVLSLFRWDGLSRPEFVGLGNYEALFEDPVFLTNVKVSLIVVAASLVVILPSAVLLAVSLAGPERLMPLFRWLIFLPVVVPLAAVALLWGEILSPVGGMANQALGWFGIEPVAWLGDDSTALWALIGVSIWCTAGLHVVLQLSALSAIPTELREAARLETRSAWKLLRHVVLPLMRESITLSAALIVTGCFAYFTGLAFVMTLGGPLHETEVLGLRAYLRGFNALDFGGANATTVVTMLITMALTGLILYLGGRKRIEY